MTAKKSDLIPALTGEESTAIKAEVVPVAEKPGKAKSEKADKTAFCVYIGPSLPGVIQSGTVCKGGRAAAEAALKHAIERHPLIARLIVSDKTLAEDRIKAKTPGNALHVLYKRLASGQKN